MEHLQECALCRIFPKVPQTVVSPVAGGHINLHRICYRFFIQLHLIGDLLPHVSEQCSLQTSKVCTYKVNIDKRIIGTEGNIGELYGMLSVLQSCSSK
jgi:hypothetical protein